MAEFERKSRQIDSFYQTFWSIKAKEAGLKMPEIEPCDRTVQELAQLRINKRGVLFIPNGLDVEQFDKMFPQMNLSNRVDDETIPGGWFDIEMELDAPNKNITESEAKKLFSSQGREGQSLPVYIAASHVQKELTGQYLDQKTWSRLPGSQKGDLVIGAGFRKDGHLRTVLLHPGTHRESIGVRSQGRKDSVSAIKKEDKPNKILFGYAEANPVLL